MEDNEGNEVVFNRTRTYKKYSSGIKKVPNSEDLEIHKSDLSTNNDISILEPKKYVETHLPFSLKDYFLFDGERLLEWFSGDSEEVKTAIEQLSQKDLVGNVKSRTQTQKENLREALDKLNAQLADFIKQKDNLDKGYEKDKEELKKNNARIDELTKQKEDNEKIRDSTNGNPNDLLEEINDYEKDIKDREKEVEDLTNNHMKYLLNNFSSVLGHSALKNFVKKYDEKLEEPNIIKYPIKNTQEVLEFLDFLIEDKKCICGSDLIEGTSAFKNLNDLKEDILNLGTFNNSILNDKIQAYLQKYPLDLNKVIDDYWENDERIKGIIDTKTSLLSNKQEKYDSIIKDIDLDEVNNIIKTNKRLIMNLEVKNTPLQENIDEYPEKLAKIESQINQVKANGETEQLIQKKIDFCENIIKYCKYIEEELGLRLHKHIEKAVNEEFQSIYNGDGSRNKYKKIIIDKSFNISIKKVDGELNTSLDPSSGAQLAVALAFITAINSSSGYKLPQIMDTSLGRWGNRLRRNFSKTLPDYLENHQMVFLFLDSEYTGEFKEKISKYVGKEYLLEDNGRNDTYVTEIIQT